MSSKKIHTKTALLTAFILLIIDQAVKYLVRLFLSDGRKIEVISGFFRLCFVQNKGATFGLFQGTAYILTAISFIVMIVMLLMIVNKKPKTNFSLFALALIMSGGVGNLIDRIKLGYVVDMFDFYAVWSFVFNFADCCIVVGVVMLIIYEIHEMILESRKKEITENA